MQQGPGFTSRGLRVFEPERSRAFFLRPSLIPSETPSARLGHMTDRSPRLATHSEASPKVHRILNEGCRPWTPRPIPSFLSYVRGRVDDCVYKRYGNRTVVTRVPSFDGYVPTAAQRSQRDRMRAATAFAKQVYAHAAAKISTLLPPDNAGAGPFAWRSAIIFRPKHPPKRACSARRACLPQPRKARSPRTTPTPARRTRPRLGPRPYPTAAIAFATTVPTVSCRLKCS